MSLLALLAALAASPEPATPPAKALAPAQIVEAAPIADWVAIAPADLLVMDLAPDAAQRPRRVVIQLLPAPFSQGWVGNIRKLAAAHWWDGTSINRAQDNYVVQWGDPDGEDKTKAKRLPRSLSVIAQSEYVVPYSVGLFAKRWDQEIRDAKYQFVPVPPPPANWNGFSDPYSKAFSFVGGFPVGMTLANVNEMTTDSRTGRSFPAMFSVPTSVWPVHCYGTVGVGRNEPPDTGTGAELYAVIGHAPRQLDRNIAVVGRVIEGMEHLSTLPRGTGDLGFYKTAPERTPIRSIRNGTDVPDLPAFEYLGTESTSFARYADARANRRDAFYIQPAGGVDICNVPVPIRRRK
ncbi:MAG: peptidylprolyl isomerase [Novosphingobium sp. 16-62-11]|uniref:peptidylprolyl isomerase n=1 Tax=Novosphingobium sp. 17-62-19 TaxID=1970406 RepID=UPI000BCB1A40|nr:peptidylprolyl isomerase [Novosphingobium sp. 17-62-19]OYZ39231.1 MAG: peptidylprolyl isomerase [Novosphingobium sp. 16-62-11]OZA16764.1 MAG: peptidylprolyl isomerase [Novosphingobium sp. 17-62-19]HQS96974.1 peptidylprolyl isomerase [Novosphingobium sp.]